MMEDEDFYDPLDPCFVLDGELPSFSDGEILESDASSAPSSPTLYIEDDLDILILRKDALRNEAADRVGEVKKPSETPQDSPSLPLRARKRSSRSSTSRSFVESMKELECEEERLKKFQEYQRQLSKQINATSDENQRFQLFMKYVKNAPEAGEEAELLVDDERVVDMEIATSDEEEGEVTCANKLLNDWIVVDDDDDIAEEEEDSPAAEVEDKKQELSTTAVRVDEDEELAALRECVLQSMKPKKVPEDLCSTKTVDLDTVEEKVAEGKKEEPVSNSLTTSTPSSSPRKSLSSSKYRKSVYKRRRVIPNAKITNVDVRNRSNKRFVIAVDESSDSEVEVKRSKTSSPVKEAAVPVEQDLAKTLQLQQRLAGDKDALINSQLSYTHSLKLCSGKKAEVMKLQQDFKKVAVLFQKLRNKYNTSRKELEELEKKTSKQKILMTLKEKSYKANAGRLMSLLKKSGLPITDNKPPLNSKNSKIDPFLPLCPFFLNGACKDAGCEFQHPSWNIKKQLQPAKVSCDTQEAAVAPLPTEHKPPSPRKPSSLGVNVKVFCDVCRLHVSTSTHHLRTDKFCDSCVEALRGNTDGYSVQDWLKIFHHYLCRLHAYQQRAAPSDEVVAKVVVLCDEVCRRFPDSVILIEHSLEFRKWNRKCPIPLTLLKSLVKRVANFKVLQRCLGLIEDFPSRKQLMEFAIYLPEFCCSSTSLLELIMSYCYLLEVAVDGLGIKSFLLNFLIASDSDSNSHRLSIDHKYFLWLCLIHLTLQGTMPKFPQSSFRSLDLLAQELLLFDDLQFSKDKTASIEGIFLKSCSHIHNRSFSSIEDILAYKSSYLMQNLSLTKFEMHFEIVLLRYVFWDQSKSSKAECLTLRYCQLLVIRHAVFCLIPIWCKLTWQVSTIPESPLETLRDTGSVYSVHNIVLTHCVVHHCVTGEFDMAHNAKVSWLRDAILSSYENDFQDDLLAYRHFLGLLHDTEVSQTLHWKPLGKFLELGDASVSICFNYLSLHKLLFGSSAEILEQLITLIPRFSSTSNKLQLLSFIAQQSADLSQDEETFLRVNKKVIDEVVFLVRYQAFGSVQKCVANILQNISFTCLSSDKILTLMQPLLTRLPACYPVLKVLCERLIQEKRAVHDAFSLCLNASFHLPACLDFWQMYYRLLSLVYKQAVNPSQELFDRALTALPLSRHLWNEYLGVVRSAKLTKSELRISERMTKLGIDIAGS